jgi:hypothetical protein
LPFPHTTVTRRTTPYRFKQNRATAPPAASINSSSGTPNSSTVRLSTAPISAAVKISLIHHLTLYDEPNAAPMKAIALLTILIAVLAIAARNFRRTP